MLRRREVVAERAEAGPVIYLCRHGETEFNRAGRYQGQADSPLTAQGCVA